MTRWDAARLVALDGLVSLVLIAISIRWVMGANQPAFAILDVAELYRLKETEIAAVLVNHAASEAERATAITRAAAFGAQVTTLLEALPQECRCVILARGAVVGASSRLPDLTPDVRQRLGL